MRQTGHDLAAWTHLNVADVRRSLHCTFHTARLALAHADEHDSQQTSRDDTDDWQQRQGGRQIIATLNELQVADDCTESASGHLHPTIQYAQ